MESNNNSNVEFILKNIQTSIENIEISQVNIYNYKTLYCISYFIVYII